VIDPMGPTTDVIDDALLVVARGYIYKWMKTRTFKKKEKKRENEHHPQSTIIKKL